MTICVIEFFLVKFLIRTRLGIEQPHEEHLRRVDSLISTAAAKFLCHRSKTFDMTQRVLRTLMCRENDETFVFLVVFLAWPKKGNKHENAAI